MCSLLKAIIHKSRNGDRSLTETREKEKRLHFASLFSYLLKVIDGIDGSILNVCSLAIKKSSPFVLPPSLHSLHLNKSIKKKKWERKRTKNKDDELFKLHPLLWFHYETHKTFLHHSFSVFFILFLSGTQIRHLLLSILDFSVQFLCVLNCIACFGWALTPISFFLSGHQMNHRENTYNRLHDADVDSKRCDTKWWRDLELKEKNCITFSRVFIVAFPHSHPTSDCRSSQSNNKSIFRINIPSETIRCMHVLYECI